MADLYGPLDTSLPQPDSHEGIWWMWAVIAVALGSLICVGVAVWGIVSRYRRSRLLQHSHAPSGSDEQSQTSPSLDKAPGRVVGSELGDSVSRDQTAPDYYEQAAFDLQLADLELGGANGTAARRAEFEGHTEVNGSDKYPPLPAYDRVPR